MRTLKDASAHRRVSKDQNESIRCCADPIYGRFYGGILVCVRPSSAPNFKGKRPKTTLFSEVAHLSLNKQNCRIGVMDIQKIL